MIEFKNKYNATEYSLIKNYRSSSHIVHFNNELLTKISNRLKKQNLEPVKKDIVSNIKLIRYASSYLEKSLAERIINDNYIGTRAILVRTNKQALMLSTFLNEASQKTKLITGLEGFSLDHLFELRTFTEYLRNNKNEAGIIFNDFWYKAKDHFKSIHKSSIHLSICLDVIQKFELNYDNQKQLIDWYEYIREIKMEDAINADNNAIIIATMHKAKGKEFDHVYLLLEDYDFNDTESKRVLYVGCSRAKKSLQIHCNSSFFDTSSLERIKFEGQTHQPNHFELILGHKDINLGSQKFFKAQSAINTYVVSIGISDYEDNNYDLNYAAKDANDIAAKFGTDETKVFKITNKKAIKEQILSVKAELMKSQVDDRVILFVAGHGLLDGNLDYYVGTHDVDFESPAVRGLPYEDLESLLDGIPARKKLMLIDACHSGEVDKDDSELVASTTTSSGTINARGFKTVVSKSEGLGLQNSFELMQELFADLRKGTGAVVISSASGAEFALESDAWKNGVFTYSILEGLENKKCDSNKDGAVQVSELKDYVFDRVSELTNGKQHPTSRRENLEYDFTVW